MNEAMISFLEFLDSRLGVTLEPAQRVFWAVAGDGVQPADLSAADRELAREIFGDVDEVPSLARAEVDVIKGAGIGGSYIGGLHLLYRALTADLNDCAPGEIRPALCVAPDLRTARIPVRAAIAAAQSVPQIKAMIVGKPTTDSIVFTRGRGRFSSVECLPASVGGRATRGRRYLEVLLDEAAFFRDESAQVNDLQVYNSVISRCTGQVWLVSTPWLETNLIWKHFEENFGAPKKALAAKLPTLLVRTDERTRALVEQARHLNPELAAQEYDCQPLGAGSAQFFGARELDDSLKRALQTIPAIEPGWTATIGADLGLVRDTSAVVAVHSSEGRLVMADALEFRPKKGKPLRLVEVMPKIALFASAHGQKVIRADHHLLTEARQHLPPGFVLKPIAGGQEAKVARHVRARASFKDGRVSIPGAFARVISQLGDVVAKPQPGGGTQITQARRNGSHGDLAQALIVALAEFERPRNRMLQAFDTAAQAERMRALRKAAGLPPQ